MSGNTRWTPEMIARAVTLRTAGETWRSIDRVLGLSPNCTADMMRRRRIQDPLKAAAVPPAPPKKKPTDPACVGRDGNHAFPAGHVITWGAITANTLLDGRSYRP